MRCTVQTLTASLMASLRTDAILTLSNFCGTKLTTSPNDSAPYLQNTMSIRHKHETKLYACTSKSCLIPYENENSLIIITDDKLI